MAPTRRVWVAVALTALAVCLPCWAWYVAGSRAVQRESDRLLKLPVERAGASAERVAGRIATRLEQLREAESTRPYQHYSHQYEESLEDCACPLLSTSPLAGGRIDPLVLTYFQLRQGGVFLPALAVQEQDPVARERQDRLFAVRADLIAARDTLIEGFDLVEDTPGEHDPAAERLLILGPFRWRTIEIGAESALVAVREVSTSVDTRVQGFAISMRALSDYVGGGAFPVSLQEGVAERPGAAPLGLAGVAWYVAVDSAAEIGAATEQASRARTRFLGTFLLGVMAALVAGGSIVALVWQSERISSMRSRFAAAAAHELRSPLAGIRLYGEMLAEGLGRADQTRSYAAKMAREAEQLGRVVTNVLGYSRLEQGAMPVHPRPGELAATVRDSVERLRPGVEAAGARVVLAIDGDLPQVAFDADAVHHIVQNLVDNAEKFSRDAADRTIRIGLESGEGGVLLSVRDHGTGLPAALRPGRLDAERLRRAGSAAGGLGLGLQLVTALVQAHGGALSCSDAADGGASFTVAFPQS